MTFACCISPGLSIRYSSDADVGGAGRAKLAAIAALGVRRFGLLLDDIPLELQHAEDRAAFADLADAHVDARRPGGVAALPGRGGPHRLPHRLLGHGTEPYLARWGRASTRASTCSGPAARSAPARSTSRTPRSSRGPRTGRRVYWDNYPVNDVAMGYELHIGPYRGRDPQLWRASTGIVANGMELFEASQIPFATIADYLRDPEGYDPEASWQRAIRDVVGGGGRGGLRAVRGQRALARA